MASGQLELTNYIQRPFGILGPVQYSADAQGASLALMDAQCLNAGQLLLTLVTETKRGKLYFRHNKLVNGNDLLSVIDIKSNGLIPEVQLDTSTNRPSSFPVFAFDIWILFGNFLSQ